MTCLPAGRPIWFQSVASGLGARPVCRSRIFVHPVADSRLGRITINFFDGPFPLMRALGRAETRRACARQGFGLAG